MLGCLKLGSYEVQGEIGRGGMGVVYRCRDAGGGEVAVKVLPAAVSPESGASFERERRLLESLGEIEGFVPVLDSGTHGADRWIAMPLLLGGTLRDRLARGPLAVDEAIAIVRDLSRAIGQKAPGDSVKIEVRRNGASRNLTAKIGERHGDDMVLHGMGRDIAREVRRNMRNQNWNFDLDADRVVVANGEVRKLRERLDRVEKRLKELEEKKSR